MKKNDWILLIAVGLYSFLFFEQNAGINFLLFNLALIALLGAKTPGLHQNKLWIFAAAGSLLSSICIAFYGNSLSVTANIISLSLLSGISLSARSSVIFSLLFSFYSYFSSPVFMFLDWGERKLKAGENASNSWLRKVWLILIPIIITLIFFFMYRASNVLFDELAGKINLDFISWNWITFTLGGLILLYGFFYHKKIRPIAEMDENASNVLNNEEKPPMILFGRTIHITDEILSGKTLFIMLNLLLLVVNGLDINFLFLGGKLPAYLTYSQFVHQGTGMLITSIVIAIAIILFYFRGSLNFYEKNKTIKFLAILWIAQNAFMLFSTVVRNNMYIAEYGITYKRIGVYVYLLLSLIGLITTFIKIGKVKSNYYLFRSNAWLFYATLILSCFFNWDKIITDYNIQSTKVLDKEYLLSLSNTNLPDLFKIQADTFQLKNSAYTPKDNHENDSYRTMDSGKKYSFESTISERFYDFMCNQHNLDWRSWQYDNSRVHRELVALNKDRKILKLELSSHGISSMKPLEEFSNITAIEAGSNNINDIREFRYFTSLQHLDLSNNNLSALNGIERLDQLEYLNISSNPIYNYSPLYSLKQLKELRISLLITDHESAQLAKNLPNTKIIKV